MGAKSLISMGNYENLRGFFTDSGLCQEPGAGISTIAREPSAGAVLSPNTPPLGAGIFICAPSMGALLEVQVLPQAGHSERSEAQLHEGDRVWGGSVERKLRADGQEPDRRRCRPSWAGQQPRNFCDLGLSGVHLAVV